jgi:Domain of unknown function (DUF4349)
MRPRENEAMSPEVERELDALEAALAGKPVDAEFDELARFARELRAGRPESLRGFDAALDARAAEGFATRRAKSAGRARRTLVPALAAATGVVVLAVGVTSTGLLEREPRGTAVPESQPVAPVPEEDTPFEREQGLAEPAAGPADARRASDSPRQFAREREIARTADLTLSTPPDDLREVADGVVEVTHGYRGFVVSSSVSSGEGETAHGDFELKLPARSLQPALDDLSELAHVSSLTEGTDDITRRFTSGRERIAELTEQRERLRAKLAEADTIEEQRSIRFELREVRRSLEAVRADLADATERVRFVPVHLSLQADAGEAGGAWSIDDALEDALRVLEVAVGVTLIMLAIAVPIAIVGLVTGIGARAWVRSSRERALHERPGETG